MTCNFIASRLRDGPFTLRTGRRHFTVGLSCALPTCLLLLHSSTVNISFLRRTDSSGWFVTVTTPLLVCLLLPQDWRKVYSNGRYSIYSCHLQHTDVCVHTAAFYRLTLPPPIPLTALHAATAALRDATHTDYHHPPPLHPTFYHTCLSTCS